MVIIEKRASLIRIQGKDNVYSVDTDRDTIHGFFGESFDSEFDVFINPKRTLSGRRSS